jgi:hypothetical protein
MVENGSNHEIKWMMIFSSISTKSTLPKRETVVPTKEIQEYLNSQKAPYISGIKCDQKNIYHELFEDASKSPNTC